MLMIIVSMIMKGMEVKHMYKSKSIGKFRFTGFDLFEWCIMFVGLGLTIYFIFTKI